MKILFTGASSFTGFWFVRSLVAAGHEVVCPLRGSPENYSGLRAERVRMLKKICELHSGMPFGTEPFLNLLTQVGPFELLCHHAAEVGDYKSPGFDVHGAFRSNTFHLPQVLAKFKQGGGRAMVVTGTVFEANEGRGSLPLRAFSPYGVSKTISFEYSRFCCEAAAVPLGKFVIPNPFGPWEEPRFTNYLLSKWRAGLPAQVRTPDYVRDNIHVDLLAGAYAGFAEQMLRRAGPLQAANPSGYVEKQGLFAERVATEMRARLSWKCDLEILPQHDFSEPLERFNFEPAAPANPGWNEAAAWDAMAEFYAPGGLQDLGRKTEGRIS